MTDQEVTDLVIKSKGCVTEKAARHLLKSREARAAQAAGEESSKPKPEAKAKTKA
jgi:hypothetical protein